MNRIEGEIAKHTAAAVLELYNVELDPEKVSIQKTNPDFRESGDLTVVIFPITRLSRKAPDVTAHEIGGYLAAHMAEVKSFGVVKGFLNILLKEQYWLDYLSEEITKENFGIDTTGKGEKLMIEFSSPNTNKPLHLGHIRNNLLGDSISRILKANGKNVVKVNLVNDRGIHICKSMLAWQKWGNGETPQSSGLKGDKLVGKYYVEFDKHLKAEIAEMVAGGAAQDDAAKNAPLMQQAQQMLQQWEAGDEEVRKLWQTMNGWVYKGFDETYKKLGIAFDKTYYESQTYLLGKEIVAEGLANKVFHQKEDKSVWIDLTEEGLDEKLLLRSDGTSVYMTQDLGTARLRFDEFQPSRMIYVVGNEQNYHFDVLKKVMKTAGFVWADGIHHLSYGMVELPEGKMKSREGTVVDADDLVDDMIATARETTETLGKTAGFSEAEAAELFSLIGLGALKYFILKVDPEKNMMFNPKESIDFNGNTGPFIQYTHARIRSMLRRSEMDITLLNVDESVTILPDERELIKLLYEFPAVVKQAGEMMSPALIANYTFELAKEYNQFYQKIPVLKEENNALQRMRLLLTAHTGKVIASAMSLLGISVPEKM
ncbi:MAG: arginine--tRNA ligase [Bacteroidota bacterium]